MTEPPGFTVSNAILVLPDRIVPRGWLSVADGLITGVGEGDGPAQAVGHADVDFGGDLLLPGLVELHTDHVEQHYAPRPHVRWHAPSAVAAYDAQIAASGITTVFDSLRAETGANADWGTEDLLTLAAAIADAGAAGHLRVDHRTHLRCEVTSPGVVEQVGAFAARFPIDLLSLMDHTPGQRQFRDVAVWRRMHGRGRTEAEVEAFLQHRLERRERYAAGQRRDLIAFARANAVTLASHDDATLAEVAEAAADRIAIAEFPTTLDAAAAAHGVGIRVMMGAPNLVRGGSHTGNVAAEALARAGVLDILSSDYIPSSLLLAAFELPRRAPPLDLAAAVATVTRNPAEAVGLTDRGVLEAGRRADLVRVHRHGATPIVRRVWCAGQIAA